MATLLAVYLSLLLGKFVQAQCNGLKTIATNADAGSISQCQTYDGDILIDAGASGDINLNGIYNLTGSLTAANATSLTSLNADNMTSIGKSLQLDNLPLLNNFGFPLLERVQAMSWTGLPLLQGLSFDTGLTETESVFVSDTGLINLSGFTPVVAGSIDVNNNPYLETIDFNDLVNVTSTLSFQANAPNMILQFESLQFVSGNFTLRNISGLSVPDLQNVTGSFTCYSCAMATFRATWLQSVGGTFAFVSTDLQSLEFPDLVSVGGGFQLSNNSQLAELSGFTMLESVQGSMVLNGVFDSVDLSSLGLIQGDVDIATTSSNDTICDIFDTFRTDEIVRGSINCQTSVTDSAATNSTNSVNSSSDSTRSIDNSSSSLSAGAIAGIVVGIVALLTFVVLGIYYYRRRQQKPLHTISKAEIDGTPTYAQLPGGRHEDRAEMYVDPRNVAEMKGQANFAAEMGSEDVNGRMGKTIPGVYEAEGDLAHTSLDRGGTMDALSPVSPLDGTTVSGGSSDGPGKSGGSRTITSSSER